MAGPDLQKVGEIARRADRVKELARQPIHRALDVRRALEEIRSADIADENEITSDHSNWSVARQTVGDDERQVLRRVTRRVTNVEANVADVELIAVRQQSRARLVSECVLPIGAALGRQQQLRTRCPCELGRARY